MSYNQETFGPSHKQLGVALQGYDDPLYVTQRNREAAQLEHLRASLSVEVP